MNNQVHRTIIRFGLICIALAITTDSLAESQLVTAAPNPDHQGRRLVVVGQPMRMLAKTGAMAPAEQADAALRRFADRLLGPAAAEIAPNLERVRDRRSLSGHQLFYLRRHRGVEVEGAGVAVRLDPRGRLLSMESGDISSLNIDNVTPRMDAAAAIARVGVEAGSDAVERGTATASLVILPEAGGRLAFRVDAGYWTPYVQYRAYVDAQSGELIQIQDRVLHEKPPTQRLSMPAPAADWLGTAAPRAGKDTGSGFVLPANPLNEHPERYNLRDGNAVIDDFRESVTLPRLDGSGFLRGSYADVVPSTTAPRANEPSLVFEYSTLGTLSHFHEVNVYWHIDRFQDYIQTELGIVSARDQSMLFLSHALPADNSFYTPGITSADAMISFGDGGVDDAEDGEVVLHEYGHAIHDDISSIGSVSGEIGAISEGFGDYVAASFGGNGIVAEWDATSYNPGPPPHLRRTDTAKTWPDDVVGEIHADGEIISGAWWDLHEQLGAQLTDQLVIESFFHINSNASFRDFADATIAVDQALYEGAHVDDIVLAYQGRGIEPTHLVATPPVLGHDRLSNLLALNWPATLSATATHNSGIAEVRVEWSLNEIAQTEFALAATDGDTFSGSFPASVEVAIGDRIRYTVFARDASVDGLESSDGPHSFSLTAPRRLVLLQNEPNPFNPSTSISFSLSAAGRTSLRVYDAAGRLVIELLNANLPAGDATPIVWDGSDSNDDPVGSGVYYYQLESGGLQETKRMVLVR